MGKKKPTWRVPFNSKGDLLDYVYDSQDPLIEWTFETNPEGKRVRRETGRGRWDDIHIFSDILRIDGIIRGRSKAQFQLVGSNGEKYVMFMTDAEEMIKTGEIHKGMIAGDWTFQKRGANIGIRLAKEEDFDAFPYR